MSDTTLPPGFEDLNVPDMIRHVQQNMDMLDEDSPEQVVYISRHLGTIMHASWKDLMDIDGHRLGQAAEYLEGF